MKKILTLFISSIFAFGCTTSFLEVKPTVTVPESTSYRTSRDIYKALMAAYAPLQVLDFSANQRAEYHPIQFISDIMADDYYGVGGSGTGDCPYLHLMADYRLTAEQSLLELWSDLYMGVYRSNIVVNRVGGIEGISEANAARIASEGKILRALYYSWLWKLWGNIPYYDVNPDGKEVAYIVPQLNADEVYEKIVKDLDEATSSGALPDAVSLGEVGRFNKYSAYMLRAEVVMLQGDETRYASVLQQLKEIINSKIYSLTPDFAQIWTTEGEWNSESIFEVNYSDNPSNRTWNDLFAPGGTVYPTFLTPDSYKGSRFAGEGYGFGPVSPALLSAYEDGDQRRNATIMDFNSYPMSGESYNPRLDDTGLFNYKYIARKGYNDQFIGTEGMELNFRNNLRIYRYSEALLRASELLVRTGGSQSEADTYLNTVRARAFKTELNSLPLERKRSASLANLLDEYRLEFALEGHRFWDLVRFGKAETVLGGKGYSSSKRYIPIPQSEIDRAEGTLKQNNY